MSISITVFQGVKKRRNSTYRPTGGTSVDAVTKGTVDIDNPVFFFHWESSFAELSNVYCPAFGRYYFITSMSIDIDNAITIYCHIDVAATYLDDIQNTSAFFVQYANTETSEITNWIIPDKRLSTTTNYFEGKNSESIDNLSSTGDIANVYAYITGKDSTAFWKMKAYQLKQLLPDTIPSGIEDIEATIGNLSNAIRSVSISQYDAPANPDASTTQEIYLGSYATGVTATVWSRARPVFYETVGIDIPTLTDTDQEIAPFRYVEPYSEFTLFLPYCGIINLPGAAMYKHKRVVINIDIDSANWNIVYDVKIGDVLVGQFSGSCGTQIPFGSSYYSSSQRFQQMRAVAQTVAGTTMTIASAASGNAFGAALGLPTAIGGITSFIEGSAASIATGGQSGGNGAVGESSVILNWTLKELSDTTLNDGAYTKKPIGIPIMKNMSLKDVTGYVQTANASVETNATMESKAELNAMLDSGIYIESHLP